MPMKRKNKSKRGCIDSDLEMDWFKANRKRQRRRTQLAKASRKANRG